MEEGVVSMEKVALRSHRTGAWPQRADRPRSVPERSDVLWLSLSASEMALAEVPNLERFDTYQKTVKTLLEARIRGYTVHTETYRSPLGRFQRMVYVTAIDRELELLRQELLVDHIGTGILRHFDAIRGLLLDLST